MMKRVIALLLCLLMLLPCIVACSKDPEDKGAFIRMYLAEPIYDFDPLLAFENSDHLQVIGLLFSGLFKADEDGDVKPDLVDDYEYIYDEKEDRYYLSLTLKETKWSDGSPLIAKHAKAAFDRLFKTSHPATAMLYEIKNARKIVSGDISKDALKVKCVDDTTLEIEFEHDIDVDAFLQVLASPALFPIRDDIVDYDPNWAKTTTTLACSGPFRVRRMNYDDKDGFVLERNSYYFRDKKKDDVDKYVTPYRIICDFTTPIEEQLANFDTREVGSIYFLGNIPLSGRNTAAFSALVEDGDLTDTNSTHVYYMNQKAVIGDKALFADAAVRKALSMALDRDAIARELVFAKAANGLVPNTVLNRADKSATFRDKAEQSIATTPAVQEAKSLLQQAGITASNYSFKITVAAYDTDHVAVAELAKAAWSALGFNVTVEKLGVETVYEIDPITGEVKLDEKTGKPIEAGYVKDLYKEAYAAGNYEVIALDLVSTGVDAFSVLAPFATAFSGNLTEMNASINPSYALTPHMTGYSSAAYDEKIEAAFAEKNHKKRAVILHEAEAMLLEDMPAIPVVFNMNFALASGKLGSIKSSFFCTSIFTETSLSNYWELAIAEQFVTPTVEKEEEEK
jgi:ABC-type oligopeptide transport system substrate-binding subunit